jgi:hypothetical protein
MSLPNSVQRMTTVPPPSRPRFGWRVRFSDRPGDMAVTIERWSRDGKRYQRAESDNFWAALRVVRAR